MSSSRTIPGQIDQEALIQLGKIMRQQARSVRVQPPVVASVNNIVSSKPPLTNIGTSSEPEIGVMNSTDLVPVGATMGMTGMFGADGSSMIEGRLRDGLDINILDHAQSMLEKGRILKLTLEIAGEQVLVEFVRQSTFGSLEFRTLDGATHYAFTVSQYKKDLPVSLLVSRKREHGKAMYKPDDRVSGYILSIQ